MVFDEEKCFHTEKEVKGIFKDNGTLLDTPIDEFVFSSELYKSLEAEKQGDDLEKPGNYDVPIVRDDHYEALTGEGEFAVSDMRILFGNDRVKDGQQFVTTEGFKEDNLGSKVQ